MQIHALIIAASMMSSSVIAQYVTDFEALNGSAAGVGLAGQDGYYLPSGTSDDFNVHSYAGNPLGIPQNPTGGSQFILGVGPGGSRRARVDRDMTYGAGTGVWICGFDFLVSFNGTLPAAQSIGSFALQPFRASQSYVALASWSDLATATNWEVQYRWYDAAGNEILEAVADPGFQNLSADTWYRWETDIDLDTNEILEVRITEIASGVTASHNPVGRYMYGGMAGSVTPTGFRLRAGSSVRGNVAAFDNTSIDEMPPPPSSCSDLTVTGTERHLTFTLTGAAPDSWARVLLSLTEGSSMVGFGNLGESEFGIEPPFLPVHLGFTDSNGSASREIVLPGWHKDVTSLYAQGCAIDVTRPAQGRPTAVFCTSDVEILPPR